MKVAMGVCKQDFPIKPVLGVNGNLHILLGGVHYNKSISGSSTICVRSGPGLDLIVGTERGATILVRTIHLGK